MRPTCFQSLQAKTTLTAPAYIPLMVIIEKYEPTAHYDQLLECLEELQASKSSYPPRNTETNIQPTAAEWLQDEGEDSQRFVALLEGKVVGHICITAPHDYLVNFLRKENYIDKEITANHYTEIGTFFVSPNVQKHGVGHQLFAHILQESQTLGKTPALAVVESHDSHKATNLYEKHGMQNIGYFQGTHGKNLIYVSQQNS